MGKRVWGIRKKHGRKGRGIQNTTVLIRTTPTTKNSRRGQSSMLSDSKKGRGILVLYASGMGWLMETIKNGFLTQEGRGQKGGEYLGIWDPGGTGGCAAKLAGNRK